MMRSSVLYLALLALPAIASAQAPAPAGRAFTPADWYRLTTVSSPAMSPDGRLVAFTVTTVREAENKRHSEVWVVPSAGGEPARYTSPATEASSPRFSHDGRYLFFTSPRGDGTRRAGDSPQPSEPQAPGRPGGGGQGNTWALRMDVPSGEAVQVNDYPTGSVPRSGTFAVFAQAVGGEDQEERPDSAAGGRNGDPFARMQATARPPFGAITRPLDPRRFDGRHIVDVGYKANGRGFVANRREARRWRPQQLFRQPFGDTAKQQLTNTTYSHRDVVVSPDGKWIAFVTDALLRSDSVVQAERDSLALLPYDSARDERDRNEADIFLVPINGGEPKKVAELMGSERSLAWSPDGKRLAYVASVGRAKQSKLWLLDVRGGAPRDLLGAWRYEPRSFRFLPNGDILLEASIGGSDHVYRITQDGKLTEKLSGRRRISGVSTDRAGRRVAFVASSSDRPTELYIANIDGSGERKLTGFNDVLNREIAWPTAERFTFTGVGGLEIEAWLQRPHGYAPGKKYPLVLYIHGGPHSAYGEGWFDEFHNLTGAGMWVLFTNPRGSSGYGAEFTYSTRGRWGLEDYQDLMQAVDIAARRPDVDSTRMGVTGGSYGGFMTAWITTRTNRFKAAQADRMISNWYSWYGASDAQSLTEFEFYGKPWENPTLYTELSPLTHVSKVRTPTLIVQSEEDHRTPIADAEQWFMALEKQGVPVEFVRYPRSTHDLSRTGEPWLLVDRLARLRQWFEHWLKPEPGLRAGIRP